MTLAPLSTLMQWPPPWLSLIRATLSVMVSDQPHETELLSPHLLPVSVGSQIPHTVKHTSNLSCRNPSLARCLFKANISIYFAKFKAWPAKENASGYPRWSTHPSKFSEKHLTCHFRSSMEQYTVPIMKEMNSLRFLNINMLFHKISQDSAMV